MKSKITLEAADFQLEAINQKLGMFGVEYAQYSFQGKQFYLGYINTGEMYARTIIFDSRTRRFHTKTSVGNMIEALERRRARFS